MQLSVAFALDLLSISAVNCSDDNDTEGNNGRRQGVQNFLRRVHRVSDKILEHFNRELVGDKRLVSVVNNRQTCRI